MSSIVTTEGIVHYEMDGRGLPVVLLHGWINSWAVWRDTMIYLAEHARFKVYALDFWGFGESAKEKTPPFKVSSYVSMVEQFMEIMGIQHAPVIGHAPLILKDLNLFLRKGLVRFFLRHNFSFCRKVRMYRLR